MGLSSKSLATLYTQFATMVRAGIPIQQSLATLSKSSPSVLASHVLILKDFVGRGDPLSEAMKHTKFPSLDRHVLSICEKSGALDIGLSALAQYYERHAHARRKIISAAVFPILLFLAGIFIAPLPSLILGFMGQIDYNVFHYIRDTLGFLGFLGILGAVFFGLTRLLQKTASGLLILERGLRRIPVIGDLRFTYALMQWLLSIRLMLNAGHGIFEAMDLSSQSNGSALIRDAYTRSRPMMNAQLDVSQALETTGIFPAMLIQFWSTGEKSGRLDEMLQKLVQYYEEEWQRKLDAFTAWLPRIIYGGVCVFLAYQIIKLALGYISGVTSAIE
jgi:type II secretory pathway component PulF